MNVDILAIGAHPDDVELGIGGALAKWAGRGRVVGILDLTRGEMGTRGTPEERLAEAAEAARILGVAVRENVGLPDGALANTLEQQRAIIPFLRRFRPRVLLIPRAPDRHPDHAAAYALCRDANFFSALARIESDAPPHRVAHVYAYNPYFESDRPAMAVDVSATFEVKLEALRAYRSQFFNPAYDAPATKIASKEFWDSIAVRAAYWGGQAGVAYAEPVFPETVVALEEVPGLGI